MPSESRVENPLFHPFLFWFQIFQYFTDKILSPAPPDRSKPLRRPKVAIIGAGITGVTSAAHCVGHGFDVTIFEAGGEDNLGGIWSVSDHLDPGANFNCDLPLTALRGSTIPQVSRSTR